MEGRQNEVMIHLGRPGEDGFTERVLASWGVDGHNSHTNVCSSGGRTGAAGAHLAMLVGETLPHHATAHGELAVDEMTLGRFAAFFWVGVVLVAAAVAAPWISVAAAPLALVGLLAHEHAYVQAGQSAPLA